MSVASLKSHSIGGAKPLFSPNVDIIEFSDYEPFEKYRQTITFRNNDTVAGCMKLLSSTSRFFQVIPARKDISSKVAPGLSLSYDVIFSPEEAVDYSSQLTVQTEREEYTVLIRAIGYRAKMDLPLRVVFTDAPVRHESIQDIYVRNIGRCSASFIVNTQHPFSITPREVSNLAVGDGCHFSVSFHPDKVGDHSSQIQILYTNGDVQTSIIEASARNINVKLETSTVKLSDTFISELSQTSFKIINKSDIKVSYSWKLFASPEDETKHKSRRITQLPHEIEEDSKTHRQVKREIEADDLQYSNKNFTISPLSGEIWPGMEEFITIQFHPKIEAYFENIAFCEVNGRESRLPVTIIGEGKGPDAFFSFNDLNIGEIFINSPHEYEIQLDNRGTIEATFSLIPPTTIFGNKIKFSPSEGVLAPCSSQTIKLALNCDIIGEFTEFFRWKVEGKVDELTLCVMGQTIGPQFHFNVESIDFGTVSFNFLNVAFVELSNTCEIPMNYRLRIPEDGSLLHREFDIIPATGTLLPDSTKKIRIEFLSNTCKRYNSQLVVDIIDVGENLLSIPIRANCIVPDVLLSSTKINFGDCFIDYTYSQTLDLGNTSNQPAKYEVILPQDDHKAIFTVDEIRGVVSCNSTHKIKVSICMREVGTLYMPLYVKIIGSNRPPYEVSISACAIGPIVDFDTRVIDWGKVKVLESHEKQFKIINKSPIAASFSLYFSKERESNLFSCDIRSGQVAPGSECSVVVRVSPDENMKFTEDLVVDIDGGEKTEIQLQAYGVGSSICSSIPLDIIDIGNVFTSIPVSKSFTMVNSGRKTQALQWLQMRRSRSDGPDIVFKILPERIVIQPKSSQEFTVHGCTSREGLIIENFICRTTGKTQKQIYATKIQGTFIVPLTKFSTNRLSFEYTHGEKSIPQVQTQSLIIANITALPLSILLKVSSPFSLESPECIIPVGSSKEVVIHFDPDFKHDKTSANIKQKMTVSYKDHPQRDFIDLHAMISFPNIEIQSTIVDFGTTMAGVEKKKQIIVANTGTTDAYFDWSVYLMEEDKTKEYILNVFDVMPIKGMIKAGEKSIVELLFNSKSEGAFSCSALCQVRGGPKYEIQLRGETSEIVFTADPTEIDFGLVPFFSQEQREIQISNMGKVMFLYEFDTTSLKVPNRIELIPNSGKVKPGEKQRIMIKFSPGTPEEIRETCTLFIGQCEPVQITISAIAVQQSVQLSLIQEENNIPEEVCQEARSLVSQNQSLNTRAIQKMYPSHKSKHFPSVDNEIMLEIDRLMLKNYLQKYPIVYRGKSRGGVPVGTASSDTPSSRGSTMSRPITRMIDAQYVMHKYLCDFGNVVKGTTRKKTFRISNLGVLPVSFRFDKKEFAKNGILIEPSEVKRLPGYPNTESQTVELHLQTKHKKVVVGEYSTVLSMEVINGYLIELWVKANIIIPDIEVSVTDIDFGNTYVGFAQTYTLQLHNKKEIACDWMLDYSQRSQLAGRPKSGKEIQIEERVFICSKEKGTLLAGERMNIEISFLPNSQKKYLDWIVLRCSSNPKTKKISCSGIGKEIDVQLSTFDLYLGPSLPYGAFEAPITVTNNCDYAMDFVSIDFDQKNILESERLLSCTNLNGYILVNPRVPGDDLPEDFYQIQGQTALDHQEAISDVTNAVSIDKKILFLYGPPMAGVSSLSRYLSSSLHIPLISLDEIMDHVVQNDGMISENIVEENTPFDINNKIETVLNRLRMRISHDDCRKGFIFDGLGISCLLTDYQKTQIILRACHPSSVTTLVLSVTESQIKLRTINISELEVINALQESVVDEMTDDEFDMLDNDRKQDIEKKLREHRLRREQLDNLKHEKQLRMELDKNDSMDVVSFIHTKIEDDKIIRLQQEEARKKRKKKQVKNAPPTPEIEVPPTFEELNIIADTDDHIIRRLKQFRTSYIGIIGILESGYRTDEELELERLELESAKKKRTKSKKKDTLDEQSVPPKVYYFVNNSSFEELVNSIEQALPDGFLQEEQQTSAVEVIPDLLIPDSYTRQKIHIPSQRKDKDIQHISLFSGDEEKQKCTRWTLPPQSKVKMFVRFSSPVVGTFESVLHFCVYGKKSSFKVKCKGVVNYPDISTHDRTLFPRRIKQRIEKLVVVKKYIMSERCFDFGPLLRRDSYTEIQETPNHITSTKYYETFTLTNNGLFDVELNILMRGNSNNFSVEPKSLLIKKDQTGSIKLWGLPRTTGVVRDSVICTIKDNPIPFQFDVQLTGAEPKATVDRQSVDFGRVLLKNNTSAEVIVLKNICPIPISWKLSETHSLSSEFVIEPKLGRLEVGEIIDVRIVFHPKQPSLVKDFLIINVTDEDEFKKPDQIKIAILAESFNLEAKIDSDLNFGTIKVVDGATKTIQLSNSGKYEIHYNFDIPKHLQKLFTFTPLSGSLDPKAKGATTITIYFKSHTEKKLKNCTDISCILTDAKTKELLSNIKLNINVEAVFSKFTVSPLHGVNFGPINFDKQKIKQIEISNEGVFPFTFQLFDLKTGKVEEIDRPQSKSKKVPQKKKDIKSIKKEITVGRFLIEPHTGEVLPGTKEKVCVTFCGEGSNTFKEVLGIDISGREITSDPHGIPFDLQGESCIPGIITNDFDSIFEEQQIVQNIDQVTGNKGCIFCSDDRVFHFGTVGAGRKVAEKVKVINPNKVPCNVECSVRPRDVSDSASSAAFDVQPQKLFVPPHEHRYVTVYFEPRSLFSYSAILDAVVTDGKDPSTNNLRIEIRGDGSLPRIVVKQPMSEESGPHNLQFPRTMVSRRTELPIMIQNEGVLSATVRFDLKPQESILFPEKSQEFLLNSGDTKTFTIAFEPKKVEKIDSQLTMVVLNNHFENTIFRILAEGFKEDITFDDLPNNQSEDSLHFGFCDVGRPKQFSFNLVNHSPDHIKYIWKSIPAITVSPMFGHIHSKTSQDITVTLLSSEPLEYINQLLPVEFAKIRYLGEMKEWNERHKTIKWIQVDEEEEKRKIEEEQLRIEEEKNKKKKGRPKSKKERDVPTSTQAPYEVKLVSRRVEEVNPEPEIDFLQTIPPKSLKISALADHASFECNFPPSVVFKLTKMFETRRITLSMKNIGRVDMTYNWIGHQFDGSPFSISPAAGILTLHSEQTFTLKYSPMDVGDHRTRLECIIPNTKQDCPSIDLSGTSLCPIVHFELSPNDYLTSGRRVSTSKGPGGLFGMIEIDTKVMEISSCGIRIRNTRRFYVLNPTDLSYEFEWQRIYENEETEDSFNCTTKRGIIHSGKKAEIVFEYTPFHLQTCESYWVFCIPSKKITIPFLLVGHAKEPDIYLDTPRMNFQTVLVGKPSKKILTLVNKENIPFSFSFAQTCLDGSLGETNSGKVLSIQPTSGTIAADEEMPITIAFTPKNESPYNFMLTCQVKKKPTLLTCNIKGEGFIVHERLEFDGKSILAPHVPNRLSFDRTQINEKKVKKVVIFNDGNYNFDFSWHHPADGAIQIEPMDGTVCKRGRQTCDIIFTPSSQITIENYKCICKVTNGGTYVIYINASGTKPKVNFSFTQYEFGPCFLFYNGMSPRSTLLEIRNDDVHELGYEVFFDNKVHFEVEATATVLKPGETKKVPVIFKPKEIKYYKEVVTFEINGLFKVPVIVSGEGTSARIELWNPIDKLINFGPLQVGDTVETTIAIVNKSKIKAEISIPSEVYAQMTKHYITLSLKKGATVVLEPKTQYPITIHYRPEVRLSTWSHELLIHVAGRTKTLSTITGACQGIEAKLNTSLLSFGPIIRGTQVVHKIVLENSGDVSVKFVWNTEKLSEEFDIFPKKGIAAANGEVSIDITYSPGEKSKPVINNKVQCIVEGLSQPLVLALNGSCKHNNSENSEKLQFKINVRQIQKKLVRLTNPTKSDWKLKPEIDNSVFYGAELVDLPAGQTREYEINYAPVRMTEGLPDFGTLFFPRPDGDAFSFQLAGEAIEPLPVDNISRELFAKEQHQENLFIENWLGRAQRFRVMPEITVSQPNYLKAVEYIDVPPLSKREYKFSFYAYKEASFSGKVVFRNEQTKEFLFYNISYRINPPRVIQTLTFESIIRQKSCQSVTIENPLPTDTTLSIKCDSRDIVVPSDLVIPATSVAKLDICYFPLMIDPSGTNSRTHEEKELVLSNSELGSFPYLLKLKAVPAGPEKNIHFSVGLGTSMTQTVRFTNFCGVATEYTCKLETTNFVLSDSKPIKTHPSGLNGKEESIDITFEPNQLGDTSDKLIVSSKQGGEYTFHLFGHCLPPKPQGPLDVLPNAPASISFKNVFGKKMDYKFSVDNDMFIVKPESVSMTPKQKIQVLVSLKIGGKTQQVSTSTQRIYGKLTASIKDKSVNLNSPQWVYYLLGNK